MNDIELMERDIRRALPSVWTRVRRPRNPQGEWWLDTKQEDHVVTIQWSKRRGFGVSASALGEGYGEGPEETIESREGALKRILELLATKGYTRPPEGVVLRELRGLAGITQEALGEKLGVQQAAVSRLERRDDVTLSSLRRFVSALGAELEISVRTPAGNRVRLVGGGNLKRR
jgi:Helix-turn-helix domain